MSAAIDSICDINGSSAGAPGATARLHQFARLLRDNGFTVSHRDVADAVRYLATMVEHREIVLRRVLRSLFCSRAPELARFDEIFDAYWLSRVGRRSRLQRQGIYGQERGMAGHGQEFSGGARGLLDYLEWSADLEKTRGDTEEHGVKEEGSATRLGGTSHRQGATTKDFGRLVDPVEREQLLALAERLGARMRYRIARRRKVRAKGRSVDLRRSIRHSLATGGFPLKLLRKVKKEPPISIVVFVDVSGSMDAYSLFFTRFVHALSGQFARAESFIFHTRLVHISRTLREADPAKMMEKIALISQGWSGGTRIGDALAMFNAQYAREFTNSRTVALIMSDGFDAGAPDALVTELRRLKQCCHKVVWLNPMLGRDSYQPDTKSMAAALPYLDTFAPAHNLRSLLLLESLLVRS